jgi:hypothetical protein
MVQNEAIRDLPIAVIFRNYIDVRRVLVHAMISSRIRALIKSPL